MESVTLLTNSIYCRLCSEENSNGIDLFTADENSDDLCTLINRYLPVKVENGDSFPKTICPGCHIQLEATKLFMDLIIEGQGKLRSLLKVQQELFHREEKERQKLEQVLHNHNPNASVETYTIQTDENGEKYIIQIYSDGPLFSPEHQLALKAEGLDKPKRRRGRPPKPIFVEEVTCELPQGKEEEDPLAISTQPEPPPREDSTTRHKRKIRPPARYEGVVQGKELVKILKKEGVIDEEGDGLEEEKPSKKEKGFAPQKPDTPKTVIGKVVTENGEDQVEQLIFAKPRIPKVKTKGPGKQKFSCDICKREFQHYGRCEMHKRTHNIHYSCQHSGCSVQAENREAIIKHQQQTKHEGITTFERISKIDGTVVLPDADVLPNESALPSETDEGKLLKCEQCDKSFTCKQNYAVHMKAIHIGERPFKCEKCEKVFAYACSLKSHMIAHKVKTECILEVYNCDVCDKVFQHPSSLMYHKDTEHGNRRFICNKCDKSFKHRQLLLRHQLVHSEERPFKCDECHRQFKSKTNLVNHENIHKGFKKFVCPICGNTFLHKTSLWVHLKWHNGNKPYECSVCKKAFSQKGNLIEHERIHTGEKPFKCNLCGRTFTTSSQCKLHMKRHTGEKPYGCKYCQKHFLHKETYDSHIRRHLDERPFHCRFCTKSFPEHWACTRHERIHLGLKKYKCDICNKAFSDGANFTKHKKIHLKNGIKPDTLDKKREENADKPVEESSPIINMDIQLLAADKEETNNKDDPILVKSENIQFHNILDQEGNTVSITTADGQPIPIVSAGNEKFQGLLPDGTLVSFDILPDEQSKLQEQESTEMTKSSEVNLLNTEIQFLEDASISNASESSATEKPAFLSEDGKVCFITTFDENSFLAMN